jgi:hypothetical protein
VNGPSGVEEALDDWERAYAERTAAMRAAGCARGVHGYRRDPDGVWRCVAEPCRVVAPVQPGVTGSGESAGPLAREMLRIGDRS